MTRVLPWLATGVTVGTLPYVVLKISWLAGGEMGLRDPALMQTTTYVGRELDHACPGSRRSSPGLGARARRAAAAPLCSGPVGLGCDGADGDARAVCARDRHSWATRRPSGSPVMPCTRGYTSSS